MTKQSYGVYLTYYLDNNTFPESRPRDFAFIGGLNFASAMAVSPLTTALVRERSLQLAMCIGIVLQATGFVTASLAHRIWHLYLSQGVLVGLGTGFLYIPSIAVLPQWFAKKRSFVNGISAAGSGIGGAAFAWGTSRMIEQISLAWALRTTGIAAFVANSLATAMIRDRNKDIRPVQLALDTCLFLRLDVWLLLLWAFISMLGYIILLYSLGDFTITIGLSRAQSTNVIGLLNVGTAIGRPLIGIWSDSFRRVDVAAILTLLVGVLCFALWIPATGYALTTVFAIPIGAIVGVFWMVKYSSTEVRHVRND
jgi:MFS family permease